MRIVRSAEEYDDAVAAAQARGASRVRRRHDPGREVRRARPAHRGAGAGRRPRQRGPPLRARLLHPAPAPEGARGGAGPDDHAGGPQARHRVARSPWRAHVGYENAGTVEFLLDAEHRRGLLPRDEHPAPGRAPGHRGWSTGPRPGASSSSAVAAGEPLPFTQDDVTRHRPRDRGAGLRRGPVRRLPARRPARPTHRALAGAARGSTHALESGQVVSTAYDPMLGKVIVHGPDREAARRALVAALDDTAILGLTTNVGFLRALAASDEFRDATIDTAWLDRRERPSRRRRPAARSSRPGPSAMLAAVTRQRAPVPAPTAGGSGADPAPILVELDRPVVVDRARPGRVDGVAGAPAARPSARRRAHRRRPPRAGRRQRRSRTSSRSCTTASASSSSAPTSSATTAAASATARSPRPMPGTVLDVRVADGRARSTRATCSACMEAMKMELALKAPFAGTVAAVDAADRRPGRARRHACSWSSPRGGSDA